MGYCYLYKRGRGSGGGAMGTVKTVLGSIISLTDSTNGKLKGLRIFGKTIQNGTPSPDAPVPLESVGDDGSLTVNIGTSQTDANPQTATFNTPNGLPGIPVSSGGNYTDENGQMWVCDEVDFARGVYVQRCNEIVLDGTEPWVGQTMSNGFFRAYFNGTKYGVLASAGRMGLFSHGSIGGTLNVSRGNFAQVSGVSAYLFLEDYQTIEELAAFMAEQYAAGTPLTIKYALATPIETPLSAEELAQYAALHTNKPNTTIFNDEGAGMEVKYMSGG